MKTIYLVSTNPVKLEIAQSYAIPYQVTLELVDMETPEIQSMSVNEIAEYSAVYAAEKLQKPVLTTDAGLFIKALNGFPGPFIKYSNHFFTSENYLDLMKGKSDRSAEWIEGLAYCEPGRDPISVQNKVKATIAKHAEGNAPGRDIQEVLILEGKEKVGAITPEQELTDFWVEHVTAWKELFSELEKQNYIQSK